MFEKVTLNSYFFLNLLVLLLFPSLTLFLNVGEFFKQGNLFLSLILLFVVKYMRAYSPENFMIDYLFYSKLLAFGFLFTINKAISIWFLFSCFGNFSPNSENIKIL